MPRLRSNFIAAFLCVSIGLADARWSAAGAADPLYELTRSGPSVGPGRGNGVRRVDRWLNERSLNVSRAGPADESGRRLAAEDSLSSTAPVATLDDDPQLQALSEAERRLFPRSASLSDSLLDPWLPVRLERAGPSLSASGLPLSMALSPVERTAPQTWPRGLSLPNLPVGFEQSTLDYVKFYRDSRRGRAIVEAWARKSGRYSRAIQAELARAGLPTDLVWMSLIESGHNPTIRSPAGAAGLWQFIPESARTYGLTVDRWVDERLDPLRSTQAAVGYLDDLYRRFGTWELAMAAYNMGHYGLMRTIRKYNTNDFWRLSRMEAALPWETALYVPKVLALAIVMHNKRAFGLGDVSPDPAVSFDTIYVPAGVPLASIAKGAGVSESAIASLNPQYLSARTPPPSDTDPDRRWAVHVPEGQGVAISERLARADIDRFSHATYRVRVGDTLASIAQRLRGSETQLRALNRIRYNERLEPNTLLIVPRGWVQTASGQPLPPRRDREPWVVVQRQRFRYPSSERVFYRTLPGDDVETLARAFEVRPEDIVLWNGLDSRAKLQSDMALSVYLPRGAVRSAVRYAREPDTGKQLEAGTTSFFSHFEGEQGRERLRIMSREGETLQSIGRRYGLSPGTMERINHFSRNVRLAAGTPVVVYAEHGPTPMEMLLSRAPAPLPPVDPPYPGALPPAPGH